MQAYTFSNATVLWFYCVRFKAVQRDVFIYICNFKLFTDKVNAYVTKHKSGFLYKKTYDLSLKCDDDQLLLLVVTKLRQGAVENADFNF